MQEVIKQHKIQRLTVSHVIRVHDYNWRNPVGNHQEFEYTGQEGLSPLYVAALTGNFVPYNCFPLLFDDKIAGEMILQSNLYTTQALRDGGDTKPESRLHRWEPVYSYELLKFVGIVAKMENVEPEFLQQKLFCPKCNRFFKVT